jgi:hypothetical protein
MAHPSQVYSIAIDARNSRDKSMTKLPRISPLVQADPGLPEKRIGVAPQVADQWRDPPRPDQPLPATGRARPGLGLVF